MRNARAISWLLAATALVVAAHVALDMRGGDSSGVLRRTALDRRADSAESLRIGRIGEPDTVISRTTGVWRIVLPFAASADKRAVMRLLDALAFSPIKDSMDDSELARLGRRRADFGLEPPKVRVEVSGPSGSAEVRFGAATPAGDGVYAAVGGMKSVFVVDTNALAAADMPVDGFRSRELFAVQPGEIGAFDVKTGTGSFMRFVRSGEGWKMSEPQDTDVSAQRVQKFLERMLGAQADGFVWPVGASNETEAASVALLAGYGLDPESAVSVTLKGRDGADRLVSFGKSAENGLVYALAHNGGAVVTVDAGLRDIALSGSGAFFDTRPFPYEESAVTAVSIADGEDQYLLAKGADGAWRLDAPVAAPADAAAVGALVARLVAMHSADLDQSGVMVGVNTNAKPVGVSREVVLGSHRLEDLRSKEVVRIDPAHVRRIVVTGADGAPTAVVYDSDRRAWNVESSPSPGVADADAVDRLLSALNPLGAVGVVKLRVSAADLGTYGLETPALAVAVDRIQEDSVRRNILVGDRARGGRYATLGSSDAVFVLPEETVRILSAPLVK